MLYYHLAQLAADFFVLCLGQVQLRAQPLHLLAQQGDLPFLVRETPLGLLRPFQRGGGLGIGLVRLLQMPTRSIAYAAVASFSATSHTLSSA